MNSFQFKAGQVNITMDCGYEPAHENEIFFLQDFFKNFVTAIQRMWILVIQVEVLGWVDTLRELNSLREWKVYIIIQPSLNTKLAMVILNMTLYDCVVLL